MKSALLPLTNPGRNCSFYRDFLICHEQNNFCMRVFCRRKCPGWLTDFGASHCLGLSGRCAPQGATVCRRAFRKIHLNPGAQSIVSRWQGTSVTHLSQTFTTLLSTRGQKEGKKEKVLPMTSPLTRACRLEDHSVRSPFPTLSAAACRGSWLKTFLLELVAAAENYFVSFLGALRKFGASWLGEREVGRFVLPPLLHPDTHAH